MKRIFSLIFCAVAALCARTSYASGLEDLMRALPAGPEMTSPAVPARPVPAERTEDSFGNGGLAFGEPICWRRGQDPVADRMHMPETLCLRSMRLISGIEAGLEVELSGEGLDGVYALELGPPHDGLFKASAVVFRRIPLIQVCAPAEAVYIELTMLIDERRRIVSEPELRSFYGTTPDTCEFPWDYHDAGYFDKYP